MIVKEGNVWWWWEAAGGGSGKEGDGCMCVNIMEVHYICVLK
jgi:hypothetical protein